MARVIVDVMLKPEIHDPQGEAVLSASHRLGFSNVTGVRQGKRFELEVAGPSDGPITPRSPGGRMVRCGRRGDHLGLYRFKTRCVVCDL